MWGYMEVVILILVLRYHPNLVQLLIDCLLQIMTIIFFCLPLSLCVLQGSYQKPVLPGKEKFFSEPTYTWLKQVYDKIYPDDEIEFVPRRYVEYKQVEVFSELFTSYKAGKNKSSNVAAIWKIPGGIIQTAQVGISNIQVGQVQYFFTRALQLIEQDVKKIIYLHTCNGLKTMLASFIMAIKRLFQLLFLIVMTFPILYL